MMNRVESSSDERQFKPSIDRIRNITSAPLTNLRLVLWWLRNTFWTRPRSKSTSVVVALSKSELTARLGKSHFEPGWELSYQYRGEILNLRRVEYSRDHKWIETSPDINWWQVHIRGYDVPRETPGDPSKLELTAHFEPEPTEHPDAHVRLDHIDGERGMSVLTSFLDEQNIEYESYFKGEE